MGGTHAENIKCKKVALLLESLMQAFDMMDFN